jgi:hypothetical protein
LKLFLLEALDKNLNLNGREMKNQEELKIELTEDISLNLIIK